MANNTRQHKHLSVFLSAKRSIAAAALVVLSAVQANAGSATSHLVATRYSAPPSGARTLCQTYDWACSTARSRAGVNQGELSLVTSINLQINRTIREISDQSQYNKEEIWALPTSRGGDCEDFALIKKLELIRRGVDPKRLLIATVLDRNRRSHAVLIYRAQNTDFVLDNLTDRVRSWRDTRYIFLRMQDPQNPARWLSGFRTS